MRIATRALSGRAMPPDHIPPFARRPQPQWPFCGGGKRRKPSAFFAKDEILAVSGPGCKRGGLGLCVWGAWKAVQL